MCAPKGGGNGGCVDVWPPCRPVEAVCELRQAACVSGNSRPSKFCLCLPVQQWAVVLRVLLCGGGTVPKATPAYDCDLHIFILGDCHILLWCDCHIVSTFGDCHTEPLR